MDSIFDRSVISTWNMVRSGFGIPGRYLNFESDFSRTEFPGKKHGYFFHFEKSPGSFVSIFDRSVDSTWSYNSRKLFESRVRFFQNWTSWKKHAYFFFHFGKSPGGFVSIFDRSVVRDPGILNPIFLELDFLEEHEYIIFNFEKSPGNVVKMFHGSVNISALINGCQRSWNSWKG